MKFAPSELDKATELVDDHEGEQGQLARKPGLCSGGHKALSQNIILQKSICLATISDNALMLAKDASSCLYSNLCIQLNDES